MTERDEAIELAKEYSHPNKHPDLNRLAIALLSEVERNEKLEADHREMKYPEFEKRTPKERYQVRFWSTRQLYTEFVIRCKDDELLMQDVFQDFMLWFVNRELRVKE